MINAINSGRVPNIENTWISMCKVECYKAFEESEQIYENSIRDSLSLNGVTEQASLKRFHQEAKSKATVNFKSKAIGDVAEEYSKLLREKIKEKFNYLAKLNNEENKNNIVRHLQKWYTVIEYKIQAAELKNPEEIEQEFKTLQYKLNEIFPQFEARAELFNDFKSKVLNFSSDFYLNKMNNEVNIIKQENKQIIDKLNQEIKETKSNFETELNKKNSAIEQYKQESIYLKDQINKLKESIAIMEKEKDLQLKNLNDKNQRVKDEYERKINDLYARLSLQEEKSKEIERKSITVIAESEKEKALYEQKIEQLTKQLEDYFKREKESGVELKSQLKEQNIAFKETTQKYETQIKTMRAELELLKEKVIDLESQNLDKDNKLEAEKSKVEDLLGRFNAERTEAIDRLNSMKAKFDFEKNNLIKDLKNKSEDFVSKENLMKIKLEEIEFKFKIKEESLKSEASKLEKDLAVLKQNNEFLEIQNKDLTNKMDEQKRAHENIIATLENKTFSMVGHEEFQKKVDEIKTYFENDKRQLEEFFEKSKLSYVAQIDLLTQKLNESEFRAKFNLEEILKESVELKLRLEKANKELILLRNEKIHISENMVQSNLEFQQRLKSLTEDYEKKSEEKETKHQKEILELNRSSEETINQMKALFETEKIRFEEKLKEEKHKNEKKNKFIIDDYEQKIKETETELRDEIENLQNERDDLENLHNEYVSGIENEMGILNTKIETLENSLKESKEAYAHVQSQLNNQIDQINENYNKERKEFLIRIEALIQDNNNKEKENVSLTVKRDQLEKLVQEKENNFLFLKKEYEEEKKDILAKLEEYKKLYVLFNIYLLFLFLY